MYVLIYNWKYGGAIVWFTLLVKNAKIRTKNPNKNAGTSLDSFFSSLTCSKTSWWELFSILLFNPFILAIWSSYVRDSSTFFLKTIPAYILEIVNNTRGE